MSERATVDIRPTLLDRIVGYVAPGLGMRRVRARAAMTLMASVSGYTGASSSRRQLAAWRHTSGQSADADFLGGQRTLIDRSRDLFRNTPVATSALRTFVTNVVGTGLQMQSRIDRAYLGLTDDEADAWQDAAEREWALWSESMLCDASATLDFASLQELVFLSHLMSGDCFVALPYLHRPGFPYDLRVMVIEADRVCNRDDALDTDELAAGIRVDRYGAPLEYHILTKHPGGLSWAAEREWVTVPAYGRETLRRNILHVFRPERPGQRRGVPVLAPVIEPLKMLDRYSEAELMAAVIASFYTVFVKTPSSAGATPLGIPGDGPVETRRQQEQGEYHLGSGAIIGLGEGEDIAIADPKRPNSEYSPFVNAVITQIGAALEIPEEVLTKQFKSSYSAARASLLQAWKTFLGRRRFLARQFCQPVYEEFLWEAVSSGRLAAPGFFDDYAVRRAYARAEWNGDAPGQIDPVKETSAYIDQIDYQLVTRDTVTRMLTGGDFDANIRQIRRERRMLEEAGVVGQRPTATVQTGQTDDPDAGDTTETEDADIDDTGTDDQEERES